MHAVQAFSNVNNMYITYESNASICMQHSLSKAIYMIKAIFSSCHCLVLFLLSWSFVFAVMESCLASQQFSPTNQCSNQPCCFFAMQSTQCMYQYKCAITFIFCCQLSLHHTLLLLFLRRSCAAPLPSVTIMPSPSSYTS